MTLNPIYFTPTVGSRIFITGATGFVGAAVARKLSQQGHRLVAVARKGGDRRNLQGIANIEIVEGDLDHPEAWLDRMRGCESLFHVAADYRIWVPNPAAMHHTNVTGTRKLMEAALAAGIKRVVYTSSVAALGGKGDGSLADENTPSTIGDMTGTYKRSKFLAEEAVREIVIQYGLPAVIVNPSTPIGRGDIKPTPTGRIVTEAAAGKMPAYVDTGLSVAHVDDVAEGHLLAWQRGEIGQRYILGGENLSLGEILTIIATICDRAPPRFKLPRRALYPLAWGAEAVAMLTKREPRLTVDALRMARKKMFFSSTRAETELGYHHRPAQEALIDAVKWFKDNGYC